MDSGLQGRARLAALSSLLLLGVSPAALADTTQNPSGGGTLVYTNAGDAYSNGATANDGIKLTPTNGDTVTATGLTRNNTAPVATSSGLDLNGTGTFNVVMRGNNFTTTSAAAVVIGTTSTSVSLDTTGGATNIFTGGLQVINFGGNTTVTTGADTFSSAVFGGNAAVAVAFGGNTVFNSQGGTFTSTQALGTGLLLESVGGTINLGNLNGGFNGHITSSGSGGTGIVGFGTGTQVNPNKLTIGATGTVAADIGFQLYDSWYTIDNFGIINGVTNSIRSVVTNNVILKLESGSTISAPVLFLGNADQVEIYAGANFSAATFDFGAGADALLLHGPGSATFDMSKTANLEAVTVDGGTWSLTNAGGYAGGYTVASGGTLSANTNLSANAITIASGGTLKGTGTVGAISLPSGGTVAPGNSIGTLNVGNFTFAAGSTYAVEADNTGASDKLASTGTVTINGGTVAVTAAAGTYTGSTNYTIITATGGVTGAFTNVTSNFTFLTPSLAYNANNVVLTLTQNITFPSVAGTPNQVASGAAMQAGGATGGVIYTALSNVTSVATARAGFDAASGEIYATMLAAQFESAIASRRAVLDRMRVMTPNDNDKGWSLWGALSADTGNIKGDGNAASASRSGVALNVGADTAITPNLRVGIETGFNESHLGISARGSKASATGGHVGGYANGSFDNWNLRGGLVYGFGTASTTRAVAFTGFADTTGSSQKADTLQFFSEAGYTIPLPGYTLEPFVEFDYTNLNAGAFTETGASAALSGTGARVDQALSTFGFAVSVPSQTFTPTLRAGIQHALTRDLAQRTLKFVTTGQSFTVLGTPLDADRAVLDANLAFNLAGARLMAGYSGAYGARTTDHALKALAVVDF